MSTDLSQLTDAQLSEAFAVEVAGMERLTHTLWVFPGGLAQPLNFATSADAVLPYLKATGWTSYSGGDANPPFKAVRVSVDRAGHDFDGYAPTFARAACIALLLARRAQNSK